MSPRAGVSIVLLITLLINQPAGSGLIYLKLPGDGLEITERAGHSSASRTRPNPRQEAPPAPTSWPRFPSSAGIIPNLGQISDPEVLFCTGEAHFTSRGVIFRVIGGGDRARPTAPLLSTSSLSGRTDSTASSFRSSAWVYRMEFDGANRVRPEELGSPIYRINFYFGNDSKRWVSGVPVYSGLVYRNLYDGIDLVFRAVAGGLKYDFIVEPGADPSRIRLRYEGASVSTDGSSLLISTPAGVLREGELGAFEGPLPLAGADVGIEHPATAYCEGGLEEVSGRVVVEGDTVGYSVVRDPGMTLVIDPLIFSTYIGGWAEDGAVSLALSPSGTIYMVGETRSLDFPSTPGAYQEALSGGRDVVVLELSHDGTSLLRATYLGGSLEERAGELKVGAEGNIYLVGTTLSPDFPVTPGCPDSTLGGDSDAFVAIFTPDCARLDFSTYLGGSSEEFGSSLEWAPDGAIYIGGETRSSDFPVTDGALNVSRPGTGDVFVAGIHADGGIFTSAVFGGSGREGSVSIRRDPAGQLVVSGSTTSTDFPVTSGAHDRSHNGGIDVFITRGSFSGPTPILQSTFLGGSGDDICTGMALDSNGIVHVAGQTFSGNFPTTAKAYSLVYSGSGDAFAASASRDLSALLFSTYIGGSGADLVSAVGLDTDGCLLLTGGTASPEFPVTQDASGTGPPAGMDVFLLKLVNGSGLRFSTLFGGKGEDAAEALVVDSEGVVCLAGRTASQDFPVSEGCHDAFYNQGGDIFVLALRPPDPPSPPRIVEVRAGPGEVELRWSPPEHDGRSPILGYRIHRGPVSSNLSLLAAVDGSTTRYRDTGVRNGTTYFYALSAFNRFEEGLMSEVVRAAPESVPGPPLNLTARPNDRTVILYWSPPENDGGWRVFEYRIYRGMEPGGLHPFATRNADATTFQDIGLENGASYFYAVSAVNRLGEGPRTGAVEATPGFPPGPPRNLRAEGVGAFIELRWEPPEFDGYNRILSYSVYKRERGALDNVVARPGPGETFWRDGPLEPGKVCSYYITARNAVGDSPPSSVVTASADEAPSAPPGVMAVSRSGPIELSWREPNSDGGSPILYYNIYRGGGEAGLFEPRARVDDALWFLDTEVTEGRRYFYRVAAVNEMGEGPASEAVSAVSDSTPPMVSLREPAEGAFLASRIVIVSGPAWDSNELLRVEVLAGGTHPAGLSAGNWSCRLELDEGRHTIVAVAMDVGGNIAVASVNVTVDLTPPQVCITRPAPGLVTSRRWMEVEGLASDNFRLESVEVSANGSIWFPAAGRPGWRALVEARHGELEVIAVATDAAGNAAVASVNVTSDLEPPYVEIVYPEDGVRVRAKACPFITRARVAASDDHALSRVELSTDGIRWVPARLDLHWSADIVLDSGEQVICARAVDAAGNVRYHNITVLVETPPPGAAPLELWAPALAAGVAAAVLGSVFLRRRRGPPPQPLNQKTNMGAGAG